MWRRIFWSRDFPPTVDKKILPDKTRVLYWYKCPYSLPMHQINEIVSLDDLPGKKKSI